MRWSLAVLWLAAAILWGGMPCSAQSGLPAGESDSKAASPWQRGWHEDRGIELPRRFGIAANFIYMERDIEVTDVTVKVGDRPPESISDRAGFDDAFLTVVSGSYRF